MEVVRLVPDAWRRALDLRVRALTEDPASFGSTVEREQGLPPEQWRARLSGSAWLVADADAGLVVHGREDDGTHALLSMWVAPEARGTGVADVLVRAVLDRAGPERVVLWVVRDNAAAERLYARHGFVPTGRTAPLPSRPELVQAEQQRVP